MHKSHEKVSTVDPYADEVGRFSGAIIVNEDVERLSLLQMSGHECLDRVRPALGTL